MSHGIVQLSYIIATALFILALHWMNAPATARRGVVAGVAGMTLAVLATWAEPVVIVNSLVSMRPSVAVPRPGMRHW